jgi:ribosomal protein L21
MISNFSIKIDLNFNTFKIIIFKKKEKKTQKKNYFYNQKYKSKKINMINFLLIIFIL